MIAPPDPAHFVRAVAGLAEQRKVLTSTAIYNTQGFKVIDKGVAIDAHLYDRLSQHQLRVPLQESVESEPSVTPQSVRDAAELVCRQQPLFGAMVADPLVRDVLLDELQLIPLPNAIAFQLTLARETQGDLWLHSLRCAITAGWLAACQGGTRYDMRMLAAAGLLHDLGMLHLDPALMQPKTELDRQQRRQLYTHALVSAMLIERHHEYPREVLSAVLEHHEALDGSGYPRHLDAASLSPAGRAMGLAELVTGLFGSMQPAPAARLQFALGMNRQRFDADLVREVMRLLPAARQNEPPIPAGDVLQSQPELERLLTSWPAAAPQGTTRARRAVMASLHDQCGQLLRTLAATGASREQVALLNPVGLAELGGELSLLVLEAVWQLRALARQARRRWQLAAGEDYPPWLQEWLDAVDALCTRHLHMS